jgi:hypothetical protein
MMMGIVAGCLLCGLHARRGRGDDGIDFEVHEIRGELRQAVSHVIRCAVFDHDIASLGINPTPAGAAAQRREKRPKMT